MREASLYLQAGRPMRSAADGSAISALGHLTTSTTFPSTLGPGTMCNIENCSDRTSCLPGVFYLLKRCTEFLDRDKSVNGWNVGEDEVPNKRVDFERGVDVRIVGIDGTWARSCVMNSVSTSTAELTTRSSLEGLNINEFFLVLSATGLVYRRCRLDWINGDKFGAVILHDSRKRRSGGA
jgi:hypothetical protein